MGALQRKGQTYCCEVKGVMIMNVRWIPIEEDLSAVKDIDEDGIMSSDYILLSFANWSIISVGRYETNADGDGAFFIGDDDVSCLSEDLFVNAWMPMIPPYKGE